MTALDLFPLPDKTIPVYGRHVGFTLRLRGEDMSEPGWLLRVLDAHRGRTGVMQILSPDGHAIAFIADPNASALVADTELPPVVRDDGLFA